MLPVGALLKPVLAGGGGPTVTLEQTVSGNQSGALPQGLTLYFAHETTQSNDFPLYVAQGNERVVTFQGFSIVGNGAAHTDTYTVVKNGVDTTMTFSITNGTSGSTAANQVDLVAGDRVSFKVDTDAATAAEDVIVQATIEQV